MVLTIIPNYEMLLNIMIILLVIKAPLRIYAGITKMDRETTYGSDAIFDGIFTLMIVVVVLIF